MKLITLKYDEETGAITSKDGVSLGHWSGIEGYENPKNNNDKDNIIELMKLGATPDDIIKMKNHGVI